jgi:ATP-dependent protease ClpP protease subunit
MAWLHPDYERSVFIQGVIDQPLVDRLTPQIMELKFKGDTSSISGQNKSVTVFIDSPGGNPGLAWRLIDLIKSPGLDNSPGKTIAYVTGRAASAAADFTIRADYSYMAPGSTMLCHGTSSGSNQSINAKTAEHLAASLRQDNEFFARQLAEAFFPRLLFILTTFGQAFTDYVADTWSGLPKLALALRGELASWQLQELINNAVRQQRQIYDLSNHVGAKLTKRPTKHKDHELEPFILREILNRKLIGAKKTGWRLSQGGLEELGADFQLLHDYYFGPHHKQTRRWATHFAHLFLQPDERVYFDIHAWATSAEKSDWMTETATPRIRDLWYFAVSLGRLLQTEDFEFGALDAYWLGLVDEVVGENLPCLRLLLDADKTA